VSSPDDNEAGLHRFLNGKELEKVEPMVIEAL
jgi:hypothetical protein